MRMFILEMYAHILNKTVIISYELVLHFTISGKNFPMALTIPKHEQ